MKRSLMIVLVAVAGCYEAPVATPRSGTYQATPVNISQNVQHQVDILFLVDNSPSMTAMQGELQNKFGRFFTVFSELARVKNIYADLQIGVVTSDYGAGAFASGACQASPGGQKGLLQALGQRARPGCVGPVGAPFIKYRFGPSGADTHNLPPAQDLAQTFTCMAEVGAEGCGFEHQLESVYAALHNTSENRGFVREDALLAVVFVTNEDDGSAPPDTEIFDPDPAKLARLGAYDTYRQTRFGVACGAPPELAPYDPLPGGPLLMCASAPNTPAAMLGSEFDLSRYLDLFTRSPAHGGLKVFPEDDIILVGIDAPETPFAVRTVLAGSGTGVAPSPSYVPCAPLAPPGCVVRLDHSCQNQVQPAFFGDPSVRLNMVIRAAKSHLVESICGDDPNQPPDYSAALRGVAEKIAITIQPGCVPAPFDRLDDPDCAVIDVTRAADDSVTSHSLPRCDRAPGTFPCWRLEVKPECAGRSPQSVGVTVDRNGLDAPPNTRAQVQCSTVAASG